MDTVPKVRPSNLVIRWRHRTVAGWSGRRRSPVPAGFVLADPAARAHFSATSVDGVTVYDLSATPSAW